MDPPPIDTTGSDPSGSSASNDSVTKSPFLTTGGVSVGAPARPGGVKSNTTLVLRDSGSGGAFPAASVSSTVTVFSPSFSTSLVPTVYVYT